MPDHSLLSQIFAFRPALLLAAGSLLLTIGGTAHAENEAEGETTANAQIPDEQTVISARKILEDNLIDYSGARIRNAAIRHANNSISICS